MRIREPRARGSWFIWLWAAMFGGIPLFILLSGATSDDGSRPVLFLLLFPAIAVAVLVSMSSMLRAGFSFEEDGIHGAHDAEKTVVPWADVERIVWRWSEETSGVKVNGQPLPDGYALHAELHDGRAVRLMQRVAPKYGQQQDLNEQLVRAQATGALPVPFDATIPTHGQGEWSGTPPPRGHMVWDGGDLPPASDSPLGQGEGGDADPAWPTG
ncbi:MAG: hypothetical protein U5L04_11485 [Trueperaceae bacterium]|nr:hypothetical protein [Trueperaceae bacterium]